MKCTQNTVADQIIAVRYKLTINTNIVIQKKMYCPISLEIRES